MPLINTVILADDDADDVDVFKEAAAAHVKLEVVKDGRELMSLLNNLLPDLLFLDLEMPNKNGLECLVEIRNNDKLKNLPVVVFSSTTRQANIQTAYEMGGHLFLIKSPAYHELVTAIRTILQLDWSKPDKIKKQYCINNRYAAFS
jgi:DNA-binding response OmpR family regulator